MMKQMLLLIIQWNHLNCLPDLAKIVQLTFVFPCHSLFLSSCTWAHNYFLCLLHVMSMEKLECWAWLLQWALAYHCKTSRRNQHCEFLCPNRSKVWMSMRPAIEIGWSCECSFTRPSWAVALWLKMFPWDTLSLQYEAQHVDKSGVRSLRRRKYCH